MKKVKDTLKSVRAKLFLTLCFVIVIIVLFLILLNNFVLETFYLYSKQKTLMGVYNSINEHYSNPNSNVDMETELEKVALNNDFDIIVKTDEGILLYSSNKDFSNTIAKITEIEESATSIINRRDILYFDKRIIIRQVEDNRTNLNFILLTGTLNNGNTLNIRIPISSIRESVKISNNFLYLIASLGLLIGGVVVLFVSRRFTAPIIELNMIAKRMARLDFSKKYRITDTDDEINELGGNINVVSDKLEQTIKELRETNLELEKDIEEKSRIDEMRKQFISDVSHELKTPISMIQGYAEGLKENVNTDKESREYYVDVIMDETEKMDKLVKQLLELMKLEYGRREFNNQKFDITELVSEVIRKSKLLTEERNINVELKYEGPIYVYADDFYIEQVITNYYTNAMKHVEEINNKKLIKIEVNVVPEREKVRVTIYNTGAKISEENINKVWNRFYKVDSSRNRETGGTGIGLSLVRAIMNNYNNDYGVVNIDNGVEFFFELDLIKED